MEKAPRKKSRRALRKQTVLLLTLGCALLAGAGLWLLRAAPSAPSGAPETEETVLLLSRPREEIASVAISPPEGGAYLLTRQKDSFVLSDRPGDALRADLLSEMMISLTELPAESVVLPDVRHNGSVTPWDFGLDPALGSVTVTYTDGEQRELFLGYETPDQEKPQRYCLVSGDDRLFSVLWADSVPLMREGVTLVDFAQPQLDASLLDRIDMTGEITWSLHYTPSGWYMDAPFSYPLAAARTDALLDRISTMAFEACLGSADSVDLSALGLDAPALTIRFTQAASVITGETQSGETVTLPVPQTEYTLALGAETGRSGVYLSWQGKVYRASNFLLGFWKTLNPRDYWLETPVNFLINNLTRVSFTRDGAEHIYEVRLVESITENNQIATDEYGRVLYDCAVRRAGETQDMDAAAFLSWYTALASLSADGTLPADHVLSGESRGKIVLQNDHLTRIIEFYPWDALHDAVAVDGKALFYLRKTWLDSLPEAP